MLYSRCVKTAIAQALFSNDSFAKRLSDIILAEKHIAQSESGLQSLRGNLAGFDSADLTAEHFDALEEGCKFLVQWSPVLPQGFLSDLDQTVLKHILACGKGALDAKAGPTTIDVDGVLKIKIGFQKMLQSASLWYSLNNDVAELSDSLHHNIKDISVESQAVEIKSFIDAFMGKHEGFLREGAAADMVSHPGLGEDVKKLHNMIMKMQGLSLDAGANQKIEGMAQVFLNVGARWCSDEGSSFLMVLDSCAWLKLAGMEEKVSFVRAAMGFYKGDSDYKGLASDDPGRFDKLLQLERSIIFLIEKQALVEKVAGDAPKPPDMVERIRVAQELLQDEKRAAIDGAIAKCRASLGEVGIPTWKVGLAANAALAAVYSAFDQAGIDKKVFEKAQQQMDEAPSLVV